MNTRGKYTYDWPRPMVTVNALVFSIGKDTTSVLLIRRGNEPFKGRWAIPGGFLEMGETICDCAARELKEETGLKDIPLYEMKVFADPGRHPEGRLISIAYMGFCDKDRHTPKAGDDAADARWFDTRRLPELAFDHAAIISYGLSRSAHFSQEILPSITGEFDELRELAFTDELTGLHNRRYAFNLLEKLTARADSDDPLTFILFDLNDFKAINDTYGHPAGDEALKAAAAALKDACRTGDIIARIGGDEFLVIQRHRKAARRSGPISKRLQNAINSTSITHQSKTIRLSASTGTAVFPDEAGSVEALFSLADERLLKDKKR
ncbi:Stalked cell differentiation-controlling protein [Limihaloglobus sulfuriphilus]|uniref:diguanylate cyclase n=1 Tax=Limihaloglobus sulfuriphilus TaxID=1851148 RepID=A0A1Q2MIE1_9BACT|nr:diguanylate cyclase [Limihaloglobus sulfuriphilus]AQQ72067.1 Stalked cell differentiation-controlling protein [Limihaloglobus sulfuriphilus]